MFTKYLTVPVLLTCLLSVAGDLFQARGQAQSGTVVIRVDADSSAGAFKPVWAYFGYDEPNFTYMKDGRQLLSELAALSPGPVYVRAHNLLTTGDGTPALKWGSTNAYTEDGSGRPIYDWTIIDWIFDTYHELGMKPLVEIGFMPEALSVKPQPYQHKWPDEPIAAGWAYPPRDHQKWAEMVYQWVRHSVQRYGREEVESWYWEAWNEPDIQYWQGTDDEYLKLHDYTADAVKRALPGIRMGGPHSTNPRRENAAAFLKKFLEHCRRGQNHATGRTGAPLDYVGFHVKGVPQLVDGRVQMGLHLQLQSVARGFEILASFPEFRNLPVILGESDPEGCAACSAEMRPENAYRNGALYASYTAATLGKIWKLADRYQTNLEGVLTWAFEFEGQPYFAGFRTLSTNGINKPILNLFRMLGLMKGNRLAVESSGALDVDQILRDGVRDDPDIDALASRDNNQISVLIWNYHDDDVTASAAPIEVRLERIPRSAGRVLLHHYRIDDRHSNAYTLWLEMGSPQNPTAEQYEELKQAGQLSLASSPIWVNVESGVVRVPFSLPRQGVSLLQLDW